MTKRALSITLALIILLGIFTITSASAEGIKILANKSLKVGQTADVSLTHPETGEKLNTIWESTNPSIATVTSNGIVKGLKAGTCVVSTWWNSKLYGVKVTVKAAAKKISISKKSATLTVGKTLTLKLKNAKASKVKWSISNKKIATVSKGKVKAKKAGKATITAKYKGKKYKCKITVKAKKKVSVYTKLANYLKKNGTKDTNNYYIHWYEDGYVLWANYNFKLNYVNMCIGEPAENPKKVFDVEEGLNIGLYKSGKRKVQHLTKNPYSLYEKSYKKGTTVNTAKLKLKHTGGSELSNANSRARTLSKAGMSLWNKFLKARVGLNMKKLGFVYKK